MAPVATPLFTSVPSRDLRVLWNGCNDSSPRTRRRGSERLVDLLSSTCRQGGLLQQNSPLLVRRLQIWLGHSLYCGGNRSWRNEWLQARASLKGITTHRECSLPDTRSFHWERRLLWLLPGHTLDPPQVLGCGDHSQNWWEAGESRRSGLLFKKLEAESRVHLSVQWLQVPQNPGPFLD